MVKTVSSVYHKGLRDWMIQRVSAILIAVYSLTFILYLFSHTVLSFTEWHSLFTQTWMKVATLLFLTALLYHAWIGMWTIFTDYVKPFILRCILNCLILLSLFACFFWGLLILWSV